MAPDFENPLDGDPNDDSRDNVYTFTVVATSQSNPLLTVTEEINLRVTDAAEFGELNFTQPENSTEPHDLIVSVLDDNNSEVRDFEFEFAEGVDDDRAFIFLNEETGQFRFNVAPDFENPLDGDPNDDSRNNVYTFTVVATSQSNSDFTVTEEINLRVTDVPEFIGCLLYTSPSPRDKRQSRMPSSA